MSKEKYVEEYRGYTIRSADDGLNIYDKNGCYVMRIKTIFIHHARIKIDEILNRYNFDYKPKIDKSNFNYKSQ